VPGFRTHFRNPFLHTGVECFVFHLRGPGNGGGNPRCRDQINVGMKALVGGSGVSSRILILVYQSYLKEWGNGPPRPLLWRAFVPMSQGVGRHAVGARQD